MSLFHHKKEKGAAELPPSPPVFTPTEPDAASEGRAACMNRLESVLGTPSSKGVVLKLYLENFKSLNKTFGYDYCEDLLSQIKSYLMEVAEGNIYRYIGVEFIIILEQLSEGQACDLADEILERFGNVWKIRGVDCLCSAQIGLCSYPGHATNTDELLKRLDLAVSASSDCGPNQMAVYDSSMHTQFVRRQAVAMYLQTALEKNELEVRYRPTYNLKEGRFTRADSYMRIFIQGIGLVGAAEFMSIAEDSGQIRAIGYYALDHAGKCISQLMNTGRVFDSICIPVSPVLLVQEDFLEQVTKVLETYRIPKGKLALEVDDSALSNVYLNVNITMQELSDMGVELVLNNFGSGCAPVSSILDLPINTVKLERMFVWQLETNPKSASIAGGLIQIARELGIHIIAEGVETENQLNALNSYQCEYQQGFYYAPTMEQDVLIKVMGTTLDESRVTIEEEKLKMKM
ncbi:bifunctional diguanylate cyclase/phosphodiesterase [Enterocloster clostridioformis]|uniref:bifunctional diguanylate cyclase/phosphodiesterase n=1 Tax=Enterocloster clostridioformis TaxID=1531 RepID=UPI000480C529|nr:bifunctional diguanylate cyclase/phosphodiesterase [Enterocloster clostridioformis]